MGDWDCIAFLVVTPMKLVDELNQALQRTNVSVQLPEPEVLPVVSLF